MNPKLKSTLKTISTVLSWTVFSLLVIIGLFLLYYIISAQIYAQKGEEFEPPVALYTIISPSMEPKIKVYDVIVNRKVDDYEKLKVGDIITFSSTSTISDGMTVTHRIVEITEQDGQLAFKTKGDNNTSADNSLVPATNVFGKTIMKIPQLEIGRAHV